MSDSESDLLPSNVFTFQNENTTVCAKGPNINGANYTNLSFRNNVMTSTMHMSRNFGRHCYGEPNFDQRSMYYRRETSPMSLYSGSDMRGRNQSYYHGAMSSQRSMYNGRSGSPMSMRTIDSNTSVSAVDIAMAFKNVKFNKGDLRMIKEAYNKFMKRRIRKKIEKRRNMRLFLKGYRRKSGYDSGEQGSDSSISSDDWKSTNSAMYKDNMSSCRSTRTDLTDFRKRIKESNMYKDCTENFKQNAMKNLFAVPPANARDKSHVHNALSTSTVLNRQGFTQKERFENGFLLPSQRFNKSVASVRILERNRLQGNQNTLKPNKHINNGYMNTQERANNESNSYQEEIFSEVTVREKRTHNVEPQYDKITDQGKRSLEVEESSCSNRKRTKLSSPLKQKANGSIKGSKGTQVSQGTNAKVIKVMNGPNGENVHKGSKDVKNSKNDFEFIKPQLPVRKSGPAKTKETKEKLISKSAPPLIDAIMPHSIAQSETTTIPATQTNVSKEKQATSEEQPDVTQNSTSDLSMRPSFIKRKLFSQKMDVTERKNMSSDVINVNSPQTNVYSAIQKEKHKARKLVTNQSCLSREVAQEDNNLLDLIHKIVPPDRMNVTNVTNKTSISTSVSSKNNPVEEDDKWDVTSVISTCNNDDVSDTYTDEEIFEMDEKKKKKKNNKVEKNNCNVNNLIKVDNCRILVEKLPKNETFSTNPMVEVDKAVIPQVKNDDPKKSVYSCVKSFWDTDFESDVESSQPKMWTSAAKENQLAVKENHSKSFIREANKTIKNKSALNMSLASVSESIKSKTMPTNNMGKLKLNVSKNLNIKSLLTPKKSKVEKQKLENINQPTVDCSKSSHTEPEVKKPNKHTASSKPKKNDLEIKNNETKKQRKSDKTNKNKPTPSPDNTKNNKTTRSSNKIKNNNISMQSVNQTKTNNKITQSTNRNNEKLTQPSNKIKNNKKPTQTLNKTNTSNKPAQSPGETKNKTKTGKAQNTNPADKTVHSRCPRTPCLRSADKTVHSRCPRTPCPRHRDGGK